MPEADIDVTKLPSSFYRVTSRAIVLDGQNRLLTMINRDGNHEIPGGGWEHDETFEQSLQRELQEELGVQAKFIGQISGAWLNDHKWWGFKVLRLAAPVRETTVRLPPQRPRPPLRRLLPQRRMPPQQPRQAQRPVPLKTVRWSSRLPNWQSTTAKTVNPPMWQ